MPEITDPSILAQFNGSAPRPSIYRLPADPMAVNRDNRAANADDRASAAAERAAANDARNAGNQAAQLELERQKFDAAQAKDAREAAKGSAPLTAKERADAIAAYQSGASIDRIVAEVRAKGLAGPDSTTGLAGIRDFFPTAANQGYDKAANAARGFAGTALGFTSSQLNTPAEVEAALGSYIPKASAFDSSNRDTLERLQNLGNDARTRSIAVLGGVPDANGRVTPVDQGQGSVFQQTYNTPQASQTAAPFGSTSQDGTIPPGMQAELDAYIQQNGRNTTSEGLRGFIGSLYSKYGKQPGEGLGDYAAATANALRNGGQISTNIPAGQVPLSSADQVRNNAVNNPVGAALVGATNAVGLGGVSLLDRITGGDRVNALRNASTGNEIGMVGGEIAGSIGGTMGLGALGRQTIGRALPSVLGGGEAAAAARGIGTDALYSGVYGANQGQDPYLSAGIGAAGSGLGRVAGRAVGGAIGGARSSPAAEYLRSRSIPLTAGQTLGGVPKRLEDALTSAPVIGDVIRNRRLEGLQAFNREAFADAGRPIGANVTDLGEAGVNSLRGQMSGAYDAATAGRSAPLDAQLTTDLGDVTAQASRLPPDYAAAFDTISDRRIQPLLDRGQMTGSDYQQTQRGLRSARRSAQNVGSTGFDQEYRDVLTDAMRALEGNMRRGGGDDVVNGLNAADATRRNLGSIETAVRNAAGGSGSGENFLFTPSQLQRAGLQTQARFPGNRPMQELSDFGQEVLPSRLPDSGTASRLTALALPTALGGAGAGVGAYQDGSGGAGTGALSGLALGALLALGGTRGGQRALTSIIADRPDALRRTGQAIGRRRGMFGSAAVPLALPIARD